MKKNDTSAVYRLIVIGGGAAGLYAGAAAGLLCPAFPKKTPRTHLGAKTGTREKTHDHRIRPVQYHPQRFNQEFSRPLS